VELVPGPSPHTYLVTMIAPDRRGLLSKAAGVLALNALSVHSASVNSALLSGQAAPISTAAINTFLVSPHFGSPPAAELLRQQFALALDGQSDVIGALQKRDRDSAGTERAGHPKLAVPGAVPAPPLILWHDPGPDGGTQLVEVRATDRAGLLAVLTAVFERSGVDIEWAKITTFGASVIDVFAVSAPASGHARQALESELYAALPTPPPKPATEAG
jgi:[protein-PII] uridylyltransferase